MYPQPIPNARFKSITIDAVKETLESKLQCLKAFRLAVATDPQAPLSTVEVPLTLTAAAGVKNATNLETSTWTSDVKSVTINDFSVSFAPDKNALVHEHFLRDLAVSHGESLANILLDEIGTLLTVPNFGEITPGAGGLSAGDVRSLFAALPAKQSKSLILNGTHFSALSPVELRNLTHPAQVAGFDAVYRNDQWPTGLGALAVCPRGILIATGKPVPAALPPSVEVGSFTLSTGIVITWQTWMLPGSRVPWFGFELLFGCAVGDTNAVKLIGTGATS